MMITLKYVKEFLEERYGVIPVDELILSEDLGADNDIGIIYVSVKGKMKDTISIAWSDYAAFLEDMIENMKNK